MVSCGRSAVCSELADSSDVRVNEGTDVLDLPWNGDSDVVFWVGDGVAGVGANASA